MSFSFRCGCGFSYEGDDLDGDRHDTLSCCNCGGRKCMDCVCRVQDDACEDSCPSCCPATSSPRLHDLDDVAAEFGVDLTDNEEHPMNTAESIETIQARLDDFFASVGRDAAWAGADGIPVSVVLSAVIDDKPFVWSLEGTETPEVLSTLRTAEGAVASLDADGRVTPGATDAAIRDAVVDIRDLLVALTKPTTRGMTNIHIAGSRDQA